MQKESKIYIAGHTGMVGSAILRRLEAQGYTNLLTRSINELDLTDQLATAEFFRQEKPVYVMLAAARVGGIVANNTYRAQFIYDNLMIQNNIIHHSYLCGVKKLLFLGSSCIYPRLAPQPLKEEYLLTGELEYTNEPYAIAKIAGIKMCESYNIQYGTGYISVMPTNLYGPNDNYDLEKSHVLPALIRKMHLGKCLDEDNWKAIRIDLQKRPVESVDGSASVENILKVLSKYGIICQDPVNHISETVNPNSQTRNRKHISVKLWGTGSPLREFMHVDDLAAACVHIMENVSFHDLIQSVPPRKPLLAPPPILNTHLNLGTGTDLSIRELAERVKSIVGFHGTIEWDPSKPDGTPRKLMDVSKMKALGFEPKISLEEGIMKTYGDYLKTQ